MPLMVWNEKMSVDIASVDEQHKTLLEMLNDLFDGVQEGKAQETLATVLDGLIAYTTAHFQFEEEHFVQTGYPDTAAHKAEHDALTKQVLEIQARFKDGATGTLSLEVLNFLKNWLLNHIQVSDKAYSPHLIASGVK